MGEAEWSVDARAEAAATWDALEDDWERLVLDKVDDLEMRAFVLALYTQLAEVRAGLMAAESDLVAATNRLVARRDECMRVSSLIETCARTVVVAA
jgi:hypothetical protein